MNNENDPIITPEQSEALARAEPEGIEAGAGLPWEGLYRVHYLGTLILRADRMREGDPFAADYPFRSNDVQSWLIEARNSAQAVALCMDRMRGKGMQPVYLGTEPTHSPGPWDADDCFVFGADSGDHLAELVHICRDGHTTSANAAAMRAAPDLLKALVNVLEHQGETLPTDLFKQCASAVEKALTLPETEDSEDV